MTALTQLREYLTNKIDTYSSLKRQCEKYADTVGVAFNQIKIDELISVSTKISDLIHAEREQMERCFEAGQDNVYTCDGEIYRDLDFEDYFTTQFNEK